MPHRAVLSLVVLVLWMGAVAVSQPRPAGAEVPRVLVIDEGDLRTVGFDGRDSRLLAREATSAVWSPDASRVAYLQQVHDSDEYVLELHVVDAAGGDSRVLVTGSGFGGFAWSPDGASIAVSRQFPNHPDDPRHGIWRYDVATGVGQQLSVAEQAPFSGRWLATGLTYAPDGSQIAFVRVDPYAGNGPTQLAVIPAEGGTARILTPIGEGAVNGVDWHPGGELLLFQSVADPFQPEVSGAIEVVRLDGTARRALQTGNVFEPKWSPDGSTIGFTRDNAIHLMAADGSDVRQVVSQPERPDGSSSFLIDRFGGWSPDGNQLGFTRIVCCAPSSYGGNPPTAHTVRVGSSAVRTLGTEGASIVLSFAPAVPLADPPLVRRVSGATREETAAALSTTSVPEADAVVVARSDVYADALAGGPLAVAVDGTLLLTRRDRLHPAAEAEVRRLAPKTAYMLGGESALASQVADDLRAAGVTLVVRIAGTDRFETARLIAERVGGERAYVVEGANTDPARGWPDAVAVGPLAAVQRQPILLVTADTLPPATAAALQGRTSATIVGGTTAVGEQVEASIRGLGMTTDRIAGRSRFETAIAVADRAVASGADPELATVASGAAFADALAAGPTVARRGGVLLLAAPRALIDAEATAFWFGDRAGTFAPGSITVVGGSAALSPAMVADLDRWAQ